MIREITKDNFEKEVLKAKKPVLVDFWGKSCVQCRALEPYIERLAKKYAKRLKVVTMNIDGKQVFCIKHRIMSLPTLIIYKKGEEIKRLAGNITPQILEDAVKELLEVKS